MLTSSDKNIGEFCRINNSMNKFQLSDKMVNNLTVNGLERNIDKVKVTTIRAKLKTLKLNVSIFSPVIIRRK